MLILYIIFSAVLFAQLVYFISFQVAFNKAKDGTSTDSPQALFVSVVVCAHDEADNLRELLPLLLAQDIKTFEIIVVDDRSNDDTYDLLLQETRKDSRVRMVHVERTPPHVNGKKYALTLGIKAAQYECIVLTDADCRPDSNQWLSSMAGAFTPSTNFVLGFSPYVASPGFLNLFIRFETLLTALQYLSYAWLRNPYMGVGRNLAYRRSAFLEAKGFNHLLNITGGDDDLFVNRHATGTNTAVMVKPEAKVHSIPETTFKNFFRQKIRHLSVGKHYRFKHRALLGLFTITWMLSWFMGVPLVIFSELRYWVLGALIIRSLIVLLTVRKASDVLTERLNLWMAIPLDFIYGFYYLVTGLVALFTKKVRWKN